MNPLPRRIKLSKECSCVYDNSTFTGVGIVPLHRFNMLPMRGNVSGRN